MRISVWHVLHLILSKIVRYKTQQPSEPLIVHHPFAECKRIKLIEFLVCNCWKSEAVTFAIFGITVSTWISEMWSLWYDTNSDSSFIAHKFVGKSPVAMTGFSMLMVPSTGKTWAIGTKISSIFAATYVNWTNTAQRLNRFLHKMESQYSVCIFKLTSLCVL